MHLFKSILSDPKPLMATLYIRYFGLRKIPLLFFVRPTVVSWTNEAVTFRIPFARRNKNHHGSIYFAVLATGADLACGFLAMAAIRESGQKVSFIFKNMTADFLRRAEGPVHFTCNEGILINDLVQKAIETGERVELTVPIVATVPSKFGNEPVANFTLTLSLKKSDKKAKKDHTT